MTTLDPPGLPDVHATSPSIVALESGMLNLSDLQRMPVAELREVAAHLNIVDVSRVPKKDLVVAILREYVGTRGLMFGEGVAEILPDGYGFLRSVDYSYLPSPDDIYLPATLVDRYGLRTGVEVSGQIRRPRDRERHFALSNVDRISGEDPDHLSVLTAFDDLTALHPDRLLCLETDDPTRVAARAIDLLCPIGFGQRGLIVAPPRAGKTVLLQEIAHSVAVNHPDAILLVLLIDERPEEVTDMERSIDGEVVASTFDEPASRHVQVAEMFLEKAKHLVTFGHDVIVLLDSITRLGRAYNQEAPRTGRVLTGGIDANALQEPKRFFGSARNAEEGGSLTVIATALVETGSRMDDVIFEEFKGTGNMELVLDRSLAEQRLYPAIHVGKSGTRMEQRLLGPDRQRIATILRKLFHSMPPDAALSLLLERIRQTNSNAELAASLHSGA